MNPKYLTFADDFAASVSVGSAELISPETERDPHFGKVSVQCVSKIIKSHLSKLKQQKAPVPHLEGIVFG